jgi:hypothetical protein
VSTNLNDEALWVGSREQRCLAVHMLIASMEYHFVPGAVLIATDATQCMFPEAVPRLTKPVSLMKNDPRCAAGQRNGWIDDGACVA